MWEKCDFIDFIFYYMSFSMSQNKQASIRGTLQHIADQPAEIKSDCRPIGRIFYQVEGENVLEADLFFSEGCMYFIFYEDGKKAYANSMTPAGFQFFQNVFSQVQKGNNG